MQWDLSHQRWFSISNGSAARQALSFTVLFTSSTSVWPWVLGSLVFPARPLHRYDCGPLKPCASILHRIPKKSHSYSTNCMCAVWGMVVQGISRGRRKLCSLFAGCARCEHGAQPGLGAALAFVGLSAGSKQPNERCHSSAVAVWLMAWLSFCLAICPVLPPRLHLEKILILLWE